MSFSHPGRLDSEIPIRARPPTIPILLLKTRSQPHDAYEEYFSTSTLSPTPAPVPPPVPTSSTLSSPSSPSPLESSCPAVFSPLFVPVLEHQPNLPNLDTLENLLETAHLHKRYGGMIFTSQRAVEAWTDVVKRVESKQSYPRRGAESGEIPSSLVSSVLVAAEDGLPSMWGASRTSVGLNQVTSNQTHTREAPTKVSRPADLIDNDFDFPLYSVGPATSRALNSLVVESSRSLNSSFSALRPNVVGDHTGNGANLAQYILSHYNGLHERRLYTFYDAPRLPFTPVLGPSRGERVERDDERLSKKGLLFLVGEQRRDIIPKTLSDPDCKLHPLQRIEVDEVEVYSTGIMQSFQEDFTAKINELTKIEPRPKVIVVVVFSPQGCEAMLKSLGFIDDDRSLTEKAKTRWTSPSIHGVKDPKFVIASIGPTTKDHLKDTYGFDADVCANKPSPQGVGEGVKKFLLDKGLL